MATINETRIGEQYRKGQWLVEVVDVKPTLVITNVLQPTRLKGTRKEYVSTEWNDFVLFSSGTTETDGGGDNGSKSKTDHQTKVYSILINDDGRLVVKDKDGLVVLNMDDIHGPKGDDGFVDPVVKDGKLFFRNKKGDIINSGDVVKGEDGISYEPVWDEKAGLLRFKNSKTGELRPGGFDIKGKNGEDGKIFEPRITPDGEHLYFVDGDGKEIPGQYLIKGKDGENGREFIPHTTEDGFLFFTDSEGNEVPGTRVKVRGADGKRGIALVPQIDSDGNLHWIKQDSEELASIPPVNIKGDSVEGPEGATFTPYVKDGVLYWTNNKGLPNPDPIKISGPRGDEGKQGEQGLSAYEIWLKQGNLGTEQDFLDSLKGEQGVPAPPANFSYRDVEDFKCKVQQIDTNLIVDSNTVTDSPEKIIEARIKEIKDLRELGRQKRDESWFRKWSNWNIILLCISAFVLIGTKVASCINLTGANSLQTLNGNVGIDWTGLSVFFSIVVVVLLVAYIFCNRKRIVSILKREKREEVRDDEKSIREKRENSLKESQKTPKAHKIGLLKEFFWWCAGADKDLLAMCPGDHSKYVGIGTTIFFTALMAWFSSFIAMQLVFPEATLGNGFNWVAALFATFWMALIFSLDRFITNTMYSDGKVTISKQEFIGGLPRIVIAIILGIIISAPLELRIFKTSIEQQVVLDRNRETAEFVEQTKNEIKNEFSIKENNLRESIKEDSILLAEKYTRKEEYTNEYPLPKDTNFKEKIRIKVNEEGGYIEKLVPNEKKYNKAMETYESKHRLYVQLKNDIQEIDKHKTRSSRELDSILKNNTQIIDSIVKAKRTEYFDKQDTGLLRQLITLHSLGSKGYKPWFYKDHPTSEDSIRLAEIRTKLAVGDSLNGEEKKIYYYQYGAEHHTFAAFMDAILHSWWWFLFNSAIGLIMLLFILIDISPVLYKMMLADGRYDNYLHQEKFLAQDKIRLNLANMLKGLNDSELKRVAPFVMGDIYSKMAGDSYVYKTEKEFIDEMKGQKDVPWYRRCWPINWIMAIFWREVNKPTAPIIIFEKKEPSPDISRVNRDVFLEVLDMKKRIILASYRRWYKTQHDCIICDPIEDENKGKEPFEEDNHSKGGTADDDNIDDDNNGNEYSDDYSDNGGTEGEEANADSQNEE